MEFKGQLLNEQNIHELVLLVENGDTWMSIKGKLNDTLKNIHSEKQAKQFLRTLYTTIDNLPIKIKKQIIRYSLISLVGIMSVSAMVDSVPSDMPELRSELVHTMDSTEVDKDTVSVDTVHVTPTKVSDSLVKFLKYEEGDPKHKGEPKLKAYKLGDGMITIGWGHAEKIRRSQFKVGDTITREQAESLLEKDIKAAESTINDILSEWDEKGIEYQIDQNMYDAMVSMAFNMGRSGFRESRFIQLVKKGKYIKAKEEIKNTSTKLFKKFSGLKDRRNKESEMFGKNLPNDLLTINESDDFDWVDDIKAIESGEHFNDEDICFEDDEDCFVSILNQGGTIVYRMDIDDFTSDYLDNDYDSGILMSFVRYGSTYVGEYYDDYLDDDEINYLGGYLTVEQENRLQKILDELGHTDFTVEDSINNSFFKDLEGVFSDYTGRYDWDDFTSEALSSISYNVHQNRWHSLGVEYESILKTYDLGLDIVGAYGDEIEIRVNDVSKINQEKPMNVSNIFLSTVDKVNVSWNDWFYGELNTEGAEEEIQYAFNQFLDFMEGQLEEGKENITESDTNDFDWAEDIEAMLSPGKYFKKTGNGHYWEPIEIVRYTDTYEGPDGGLHSGYEYHTIDMDGNKKGGNGFMTKGYTEQLNDENKIKPFIPNWSIKDEIDFSNNINDVTEKNFLIEFDPPVKLDDTLGLQQILTDKGFSFYTKELGEPITNKDYDGLVSGFESYDWDTSDNSFNRMPATMWSEEKKMLLTKPGDERDWFRDPFMAEQERYRVPHHHNAVVINGYHVIRQLNGLNESEGDFEWAKDIPADDPYRYFDINVCYRNFYDEETGEDECVEGGSYFLKIFKEDVEGIWDFEPGYMAGPGDEGLDVIEFAIGRDMIEADDIDYFQYVVELDKEEYCRAWGKWNNNDADLCEGY